MSHFRCNKQQLWFVRTVETCMSVKPFPYTWSIKVPFSVVGFSIYCLNPFPDMKFKTEIQNWSLVVHSVFVEISQNNESYLTVIPGCPIRGWNCSMNARIEYLCGLYMVAKISPIHLLWKHCIPYSLQYVSFLHIWLLFLKNALTSKAKYLVIWLG